MQVQVGYSLSDIYDQEQGVPQEAFCLQRFLASKSMILWNVFVILLIAYYMLMTSVSGISQKTWGGLNVNYSKI